MNGHWVEGKAEGTTSHSEIIRKWEMQQMQRLKDSGVLVSPGEPYHIRAWPAEQGWVRISFAVEEDQLREGLSRIGACLGLKEGERDALKSTEKR